MRNSHIYVDVYDATSKPGDEPSGQTALHRAKRMITEEKAIVIYASHEQVPGGVFGLKTSPRIKKLDITRAATNSPAAITASESDSYATGCTRVRGDECQLLSRGRREDLAAKVAAYGESHYRARQVEFENYWIVIDGECASEAQQ